MAEKQSSTCNLLGLVAPFFLLELFEQQMTRGLGEHSQSDHVCHGRACQMPRGGMFSRGPEAGVHQGPMKRTNPLHCNHGGTCTPRALHQCHSNAPRKFTSRVVLNCCPCLISCHQEAACPTRTGGATQAHAKLAAGNCLR